MSVPGSAPELPGGHGPGSARPPRGPRHTGLPIRRAGRRPHVAVPGRGARCGQRRRPHAGCRTAQIRPPRALHRAPAGTSRVPRRRRAIPGDGRHRSAAGQTGDRVAARARSGPGGAVPRRCAARPAARRPRPPAGLAPCRGRPRRVWPVQRRAAAPRVATDRASASRRARGTQPPQPGRHEPAPGPRTGPAQRRRPRPGRAPPGLGATRGGPGRRLDR